MAPATSIRLCRRLEIRLVRWPYRVPPVYIRYPFLSVFAGRSLALCIILWWSLPFLLLENGSRTRPVARMDGLPALLHSSLAGVD